MVPSPESGDQMVKHLYILLCEYCPQRTVKLTTLNRAFLELWGATARPAASDHTDAYSWFCTERNPYLRAITQAAAATIPSNTKPRMTNSFVLLLLSGNSS